MTSSHTMARSLPVPLVVLLMTSLAPTTGSSSPSPPHSTQETPTDDHSVSQFHETHAHTANDITPTVIKRTSAEVTDEKFTAAIGGRSIDVADRKLLRNTMAEVPSDNDAEETGERYNAALSKRRGQESSRNKLSHDDSDSLPGSCHMHTNAVIWPRQTNTQSHRHTRSIARQTTVNGSTQAKTCTEKKVRLGDILTGRFTFGDRTWSKVANDFMGLSMYLAAQVIALCLPVYLLCVVCCGQVTERKGSRRHKPPYDQRDKAFTRRRLVFTVLTILLSLLLIVEEKLV
ncbi:uncharacterized protein [Littorina saxatilis]|uniref:uncharacterized protein n=1 Tax=Littorina saxatilis TaxID=31220 RepID=UPI0038B53527